MPQAHYDDPEKMTCAFQAHTLAVLCTRPKFQDRDQDHGVRDQDRVVQDQDRDQDRVVQDQDRDQDRVVQDQDQDRIVQDKDLSLKTINAILNCSVTYSHDSNQMFMIFIVIVLSLSLRGLMKSTLQLNTLSAGAAVAE